MGLIISLRNCEVAWGANRPDYLQRAIHTENVTSLRLENFTGSDAH